MGGPGLEAAGGGEVREGRGGILVSTLVPAY